MKNIKKLAETKKVNKTHYYQVFRSKNIAIFSSINKQYYEVIKIRVKTIDKTWFKTVPVSATSNDQVWTHREAYPSSERWGIDGFTYRTYEEASIKANKLLNKAVS